MRRSGRKISNYRGRRTLTDLLRYTAIALGVLVFLVLAGLFLLQERLVYTDDGWRIEWPSFLQKEEERPLPDPGDVSYTERPPEEEPETAEEATRAVQLPVSAVLDGTAAQLLDQAGANTLVLEMKDREGRLAWASGQELADRARVNGDQAVNQALEQWGRGDVYTVARVCCFRDNSVPYYRNTLALRSGGGNWRDELGLRWMSPASQEARDYLAALCGELAALGFDEIVLEQFAFPVRGDLERIQRGSAYDPERWSQEVERFLEEASRAVEPYGTALSLRVERDTLTGAEQSSGITVPLLETYAGRIWWEEDGLTPAPARLLEEAGLEGRLVEIREALDGADTAAQAVLSAEEEP